MMAAATAKMTNGKKSTEAELLSIAKIAFRCNLDRATCKKRLDALGYEPESDGEKLKLYLFDAKMEAELTETNDKLGEVRIRKETATAEKIEIQVAQARGELASVSEFTDIVQRLFGGCYKENIRMIKRWAPKIAKMKTSAEVEKYMLGEYQRFSNSLRADFSKFLAKK
jgi:hypothetical protein